MVQKTYVPYGSDVSAGTYKCVDCGRTYTNQSKTSMPPCPDFTVSTHPKKGWEIISGKGDSAKDPYPKS